MRWTPHRAMMACAISSPSSCSRAASSSRALLELRAHRRRGLQCHPRRIQGLSHKGGEYCKGRGRELDVSRKSMLSRSNRGEVCTR